MKNPNSLRSLATKYGISHELLRKIRDEGISITDEAAVKDRLKIVNFTVNATVNDCQQLSTLTIPAGNSETGLRAAIERLQAAEVAAHTDYCSALANNPKDAGRALKVWQTILEQLRKAEVENPSIEKENAAAVSKDELAKVLGELFKNLRMDLEALPRKIALSAGDYRDAVELAVIEEKDRIIESLYSSKYL